MSARASDVAAFDAAVARSLEALGAGAGSLAHDPLLDLRAFLDEVARCAAAAMGTEDIVLARLPGELGSAREGFADDPADAWWCKLSRSSEILAAPLRDAADVHRLEVRGVRVEVASLGDEAARALVWIDVCVGFKSGVGEPDESALSAPSRLLAACLTRGAEEDARASAEQVAYGLRALLGVPAEGETPPDESALGAAIGLPLPAGDLARYALRPEGDLVVVRDHASRGPRDTVRRNTIASACLAVIALGVWIRLAVGAINSDPISVMLGAGSVAAVLSAGAYAFWGIASFSRKYTGFTHAVAWFTPARYVVMPWTSRSGAIDLRPEGRQGAAIAVGEVRDVVVRAIDGVHVVEIDSDHGPAEVVRDRDAKVAEVWARALKDALAHGSPAQRKVAARQRLRARAREPLAARPADGA